MDDLISRQAAIDTTWEEPTYIDPINVLTEVRDRIKALPSAQPEIIRCRDCKHGKGDVFDRGWWCELHPSFDVDGDDYCSHAERRTDGVDNVPV